MNAVPVSLGERYAGLFRYDGLLRAEGDELVIEYQLREAVFGDLFRSGVRQARIPRGVIASATLQNRWLWFGSELVIQTTTLEPVADLPTMSRGRITLGIARRDRATARAFLDAVRLPGAVEAKPAPLADPLLD